MNSSQNCCQCSRNLPRIGVKPLAKSYNPKTKCRIARTYLGGRAGVGVQKLLIFWLFVVVGGRTKRLSTRQSLSALSSEAGFMVSMSLSGHVRTPEELYALQSSARPRQGSLCLLCCFPWLEIITAPNYCTRGRLDKFQNTRTINVIVFNGCSQTI